jgi:radical SAM protein with 4Fe4S-binding SPASM domain
MPPVEPSDCAENPGTAGAGSSSNLPWVPRVCVWELTLACNCKCVHCGSSAGVARAHELDTGEGLALVAELGQLGCQAVTLSGGEPLLRSDWQVLAAGVREQGMNVELITNGLCVTQQADAIANTGFVSVTFSVDGPTEVHDRLRGTAGCLGAIWHGAQALKHRGVKIAAVTQVNRLNLPLLGQIHDLLVSHGFDGWQLQLTMPHGRARQHTRSLCLEPADLPTLEQILLDLRSRSPLVIQVGDNIGYMSENEPTLRTCPGEPMHFWVGCSAGLWVIGITSDGTVRGCLSLPAAANEGKLRERSLAAIWNHPDAFAYNRRFAAENLGGTCAGCALSKLCRAGCRSLAWAVSPQNPLANPYCIRAVVAARSAATERGQRDFSRM